MSGTTTVIDGTTLVQSGNTVGVAATIQAGAAAGGTAIQPAAITGPAALVVATPAGVAGQAKPIALTRAHLASAIAGTDFSAGVVTPLGTSSPITIASLPANAPVPIGNAATIIENYTIPTSTNAASFGPVTIAPGAGVTVPVGSTWRVL